MNGYPGVAHSDLSHRNMCALGGGSVDQSKLAAVEMQGSPQY